MTELSTTEIRELLSRIADRLERGQCQAGDMETLQQCLRTLKRRRADPWLIRTIETTLESLAELGCPRTSGFH